MKFTNRALIAYGAVAVVVSGMTATTFLPHTSLDVRLGTIFLELSNKTSLAYPILNINDRNTGNYDFLRSITGAFMILLGFFIGSRRKNGLLSNFSRQKRFLQP